MVPEFQRKLLSHWERLGEGFRPRGENKETPAPIYRKRPRKGFRGQRLQIAPITPARQIYIWDILEGGAHP